MKHVSGSALGLLALGLLASQGLGDLQVVNENHRKLFGNNDCVNQPLTSEGAYNPEYTLPDDYNYCDPAMPDPETYKPMDGATLKFVQVIIRHGDRAPLKLLKGLHEEWKCSPPNEVRYHRGVGEFDFAKNTTGAPLQDGIEFNNLIYSTDDSPYHNTTGTCELEQLTDRGMAQHRELGKRLYQIYTKEELDLLPKILPKGESNSLESDGKTSPYGLNPDQPIFVRSTTYWRTRLSAQMLIEGMYPQEHREPEAQVNLITYPLSAETLVAQHVNCPRFKQMLNVVTKEQPWLDHLNENRELMDNINEAIGKTGDADFEKSFYYTTDAVMARYCHNKALPCNENNKCVEESDVKKVMTLGTWEYVFARRDSRNHKDYITLGLGWFIRELAKRWDDKLSSHQPSDSKDDVRFEVYSGHDETVTFFAAMLQQDNMMWPPYASQFVLEFWEKNNEYFVRILFNGDVVSSPVCDFNACPLNDFKEIMNQYIPKDLNACNIN